MADKTGKTWMAIGETDDPNAVIETFEAAAAQDCIGIATKTVSSGDPCPVLIRGRVKVKVGGAVTRGKAVYGADSSKRVVALADINEGGSATISWTKKLGWALETASAADDLIFIYVEK